MYAYEHVPVVLTLHIVVGISFHAVLIMFIIGVLKMQIDSKHTFIINI